MSFSRFPSIFVAAALLALAAIPARADKDVVQFGSQILVPANSSVHDAVCFFCSVDAQGPIDHDVVVFFGDIHVHQLANHDVVNFFGDVRVDSNASISHDLVHFFGDVHLGDNASVGNDMVLFFGDLHAANSATITGNRVIEPAWLLLIPLGLLVGFIWLIVTFFRNWRERRMYYPAGYPPPPPPPPPVNPS
ncbi:MAG: hypothetical protein KGN79_08815 [Acidobacteriota bacterium]|nr:hypothetical protein [Acidobacteriota bacterium]